MHLSSFLSFNKTFLLIKKKKIIKHYLYDLLDFSFGGGGRYAYLF